MTGPGEAELRVSVRFGTGHEPLFYRADVVAARNFAAAARRDPRTYVTLDNLATPDLRVLPCADLFQLV